jgi:isocitrate dehydrogenase kinase/phosphatase
LSDPRAADCAAAIVAAFARYNAAFRAISRRAPERFENRDWSGSQADVVERLELYATAVNAAVAEMRRRLGASSHDTALWADIKAVYARRIASLADPEFLKTYFSSITRRLFDTVGVDPAVEFFALELDPLRGAFAEQVKVL